MFGQCRLPSQVRPCKRLRVGNFPAAPDWDLTVQDGEEGVSAFDALAIVGTISERVG